MGFHVQILTIYASLWVVLQPWPIGEVLTSAGGFYRQHDANRRQYGDHLQYGSQHSTTTDLDGSKLGVNLETT